MSATSYRHSCRHCQGLGCIHCGNNGTVRERVFRRPDVEAARLRALLLVDRPAGNEERKKSFFLYRSTAFSGTDAARRAILA